MEYVTLANGCKNASARLRRVSGKQRQNANAVLRDAHQSRLSPHRHGAVLFQRRGGRQRRKIFGYLPRETVHHDKGVDRALWYKECRKSVMESLRKLQLDYLDLVLLHQPFVPIITAHGRPWKSCMRRVNCAPSAFRTSIPTDGGTSVPSRASNDGQSGGNTPARSAENCA